MSEKTVISSEWRELGPEEVIQAGDEVSWKPDPEYQWRTETGSRVIGTRVGLWTSHKFRRRVQEPCAACCGSGLFDYGDGEKTCLNCNGAGVFRKSNSACPTCADLQSQLTVERHRAERLATAIAAMLNENQSLRSRVAELEK